MPRRLAFRFGFVVVCCMLWPFPIGDLPFTDPVADVLNKPWDWLVGALAEHVIGIAAPSMDAGGSGDSTWAWLQVAAMLLVAAVGAAIWTGIAERRERGRAATAYPRLADWVTVALRYWLAVTMLRYGLVKVVRVQFPAPHVGVLDERVGDMSPMGLMWAFMGYSRAYSTFGGVAELVGGALLLWRRTSAIGALTVAAVMTNVAMMNLCYDVPVKLFSLTLLATAFALLAPQLRRLIAAACGHAVPAIPLRVRGSGRAERVRRAAKYGFIAVMAAGQLLELREYRAFFGDSTPLDGAWQVDAFAVGGAAQPPLATDAKRWNRLLVLGGAKVGGAVRVAIVPMTGEPLMRIAAIDGTAMVLTSKQGAVETWQYKLDGDRLELDGGAPATHVTLHRAPDGLLVTRGFHWIQEQPFNR